MKLLKLPFLVACIVTTIQAGDINTLATKHWTDKASWGHNYAEQYEIYFSPLRYKDIKLLEIGFLNGSSAFLWEEYFPNATLLHIDIKPEQYAYAKKLSPRSQLYMVDQSNEVQLKKFAEDMGGEFDIIIDDGSHIVEHQIISFKTLFPYLKSGGVYVIEDLFSSYWIEYGGAGSRKNPKASEKSTIRFLQALLDDVNYIGARNAYANIDVCPQEIVNELNYYQKNINGMHFFCNICFITKR